MKKSFIIIFIGIILISNIAIASYKEMIEGEVTGIMKKPVFISNNTNVVQGTISSINQNSYENTFNILNYIEDQNLINEINFEYFIKILPSTMNFPVKYRLIDLNTNIEVGLSSNLESQKFNIGTDRENYNYKLIIEWDMENKNQTLDENLEVQIQVIGVQVN